MVVLLAGGASWAVARPAVVARWHSNAASLAADAARVKAADPQKGIAELYLANALDPTNQTIASRLAQDLLDQDRPDEAISVLKRQGRGEDLRIAQIQFQSGQFQASLESLKGVASPQADRSIAKDYLELGKYDQAVKTALQAFSADGSPASAGLVGLCYAAAGRPNDLTAFTQSMAPSEVKPLLNRLSDKTAAGQELYNAGLLLSAKKLLADRPDTGQSYLLLAQIDLAQHQPAKPLLDDAKIYLSRGLEIDPGDLELHQLDLQLADKMGDRGAADRERQLIQQLQSGKI
jgi:tetratricopeptide (TPR) repeat protein